MVCVHNTPLLLTAELQRACMLDDRRDRAQTAVQVGRCAFRYSGDSGLR